MNSRFRFYCCSFALLIGLSVPAFAQQDDDVLVVDVAGRLTTGAPNFDGTWSLGPRSFAGQFDSDYAVTDPGWNTLGIGSPAMPAGGQALPPETDLQWDFLPMVIAGTAANLFYWGGTGEVQFGAAPSANYKLELQSKSGFFGADGSPTLVTGATIATTDSFGSIHEHRFWFVDDNDGDLGTDPLAGVYLVALRTRVLDLDRSRPVFFPFSTLDTSAASLLAAQQWVDERTDDLAPDFAADFDGDLDVDVDDLSVWQGGYGTTGDAALQIAGDANFDDVIAGLDLLEWQRQAGSSLANFTGAASPASASLLQVPEPAGMVLLLCGWGVLASRRAFTQRRAQFPRPISLL